MIRLLILLVFCLFLLTLSFNNSHSLVSLNYFFGVTTHPVPVAWLISGAFAAGMATGWLFGLPAWIRLKLELRRYKKTQEEMEQELKIQRRPAGAREYQTPGSTDPDEF